MSIAYLIISKEDESWKQKQKVIYCWHNVWDFLRYWHGILPMICQDQYWHICCFDCKDAGVCCFHLFFFLKTICGPGLSTFLNLINNVLKKRKCKTLWYTSWVHFSKFKANSKKDIYNYTRIYFLALFYYLTVPSQVATEDE